MPGTVGWIGSFINLYQIQGKDLNLRKNVGEISVWMLIIGWLVIPVAAIYLFHSVLYDSWRQMFFIYPAIILVSVQGLVNLYEWMERLPWRVNAIRIVAGILLLAGLMEPAWFMVRYHPFENIYFNVLAGNPTTIRSRFDMDYWGLSYKQGIDYIVANDPGKSIKIFVSESSGSGLHQFRDKQGR